MEQESAPFLEEERRLDCLVSSVLHAFRLLSSSVFIIDLFNVVVSYPEDELSELLDLLFLPNYGASLHILKVSIRRCT